MSDSGDFVLAPPAPAPAEAAAREAGPEVRELLLRLCAAAAEAAPEAAVQLLEIVAREAVGLLGRYDRQTLTTWRELAHRKDVAGDSAGAVNLLEQLIPDLAQAFGAADVETLHARFVLATAVGNAGDPGTAERQLRELLPALTAAVGPADARVLQAQHQLAVQRGRAGDVAGCVHQLGQLVPFVQQTLGEGHPVLDELRLDLGRYVQQLGRLPGAPAGLGWVEVVAVVYRLMVWDFDSDREAMACVADLERRTRQKGLAERIFSAPENLTADQLAVLVLGSPPGSP